MSKDKITDKFVKNHLSPIVILLGHHKVKLFDVRALFGKL